jgi:hypothetical protein
MEECLSYDLLEVEAYKYNRISFSGGMVGSVGITLQSYLKIFWKEEVKGPFNVRIFVFLWFFLG